MILTMFLLGMACVAFIALLFWAGIHPIFIFGVSLVMMLFRYFSSDKIVLMTTGAKTVTPQEEPRLHAMVERLSAMADMPKPKKVAVMETHVPNAFATGRNPKNAVIAVTRGLLARLNEREQEAVLAHGLVHIKNRDVMVLTLASLIVIMAGYLMQMLFRMSLFGGFGGGGRDRQGGGNAFMIMMAVYVGTIVIYFASQLLILALLGAKRPAACERRYHGDPPRDQGRRLRDPVGAALRP
jgi:heat shock protein HtpX